MVSLDSNKTVTKAVIEEERLLLQGSSLSSPEFLTSHSESSMEQTLNTYLWTQWSVRCREKYLVGFMRGRFLSGFPLMIWESWAGHFILLAISRDDK